MEGSELFRHAENWLKSNPGKTLRDYRKETGYSGPALKTRQRKGKPVRISYKGKSSDAEVKRAKIEKPKTEAEAAYVRETRKEARRRSQSTLHQQTYEGRPSVAEHNVRLASGGTNEALSISDPDFAAFKTEIENKLPKGYIADIDDVTGGVRIIPENIYNKFDFSSKQPGITLEPGDDINKALSQLDSPKLKVNNGAVRFSKPDAPAAPPVQVKRKPTKPAKPSRKAIAFTGGSVSFNSATPGLVPTPGVGTRMGGGYEVQDPGGLMPFPIMLP